MSHPTIGPAPRTIQPRVGYKSGAGCAKLFILPHMLIGVGVIMVFILKIAMGLVGTKTDATVLEKTWHRGSKEGLPIGFDLLSQREVRGMKGNRK